MNACPTTSGKSKDADMLTIASHRRKVLPKPAFAIRYEVIESVMKKRVVTYAK